MPRPARRVFTLVIALACVGSNQATAAAGPEEPSSTEWSAELGVGVEYDSNVSVEEVDRASNQDDYALVLDAGVGVKQALGERVDAGLTYDFSQSFYDEFSQVDRQTHILGADLGLDFNRVDPGLSVYYIDSRLDGDEFLQLTRVSPSLSGFLAKKWFARAAWVYSEKKIHERSGRDADTNAGEMDLYFFLRGLRTYFNLGYRYRDEDAKEDQYDYIGNSIKLRFIQRFEVFSRITKLEIAWRYEDRNYQSDTPSIGKPRDDQRNRFRADYEIPVMGNAAVQFFAGFADYSSNYSPADYDQTLVGTRLVFSW